MPQPLPAGAFVFMEFFTVQTGPKMTTGNTELFNSTNIERIINFLVAKARSVHSNLPEL
jgi:hypothetical protein